MFDGDIFDFVGCKMSSRIDFKTLWPRNGHADSLGVEFMCLKIY